MLIKICGLSTPETVRATIDAGADMIGLVFFEKSPRHVTIEKAAELAELARGKAEIVALTVDPSDDLLNDIVDQVSPDWIQLHGPESLERVETVKRMTGKKVMKAIGISTSSDLERASPYGDVADLLLFDAKPPNGATRPGGLGDIFDWTILENAYKEFPYLLAGGLTEHNVGEAISRSRPKGVDLSSALEDSPGVKSSSKIRSFIKTVRQIAP